MKGRGIVRKLGVLCVGLLSLVSVSCLRGAKSLPLEELSSGPAAATDYVVQSGDTLNVRVWEEPKVSGDVFVREDGKFSLPLVNEVPAVGRGLTEIADDVKVRLAEFIPASTVTVSVVQSAPIRYFLLGQFIKPGEYRSDRAITLLQAISTGGGFGEFADKSSITLIRRGPEGEKRYVLDYDRVVASREPNPDLRNGDTIVVE